MYFPLDIDVDSFPFDDDAPGLILSPPLFDDNSSTDLIDLWTFDAPIPLSSPSTPGNVRNEISHSPFSHGEDLWPQIAATTTAPLLPLPVSWSDLPPVAPILLPPIVPIPPQQSRPLSREVTPSRAEPYQRQLFVHAMQVIGSGMIPIRYPHKVVRINDHSFTFTVRSFAENVDHDLFFWLNSYQFNTIDNISEYQNRNETAALDGLIKLNIGWRDLTRLVLDLRCITDSEILQPAVLSFQLNNPNDPKFTALLHRMRTLCPDHGPHQSQNRFHITVLLKYEAQKWKSFIEKNRDQRFTVLE